MPVATFGALRTQSMRDVAQLDFPVLLSNTYHLFLRPGPEVFKQFGGIHSFMKWPHSVLTDSGGFQVFSLSQSIRITEEGALCKSYHDGKEILLSPELSILTQRAIASDIMMALDQCIPSTSDESSCLAASELTARWAERSLNAREDSPQSLFGIVQGGCYPHLRKQSASQITSLPFNGFALGGLAVGETDEERREITEFTVSLLPYDRPRYLMGVGTPYDLIEAVHRGVDMFDCIIPTAYAQQGTAFTTNGKIELRRGVYKLSTQPIDESCKCPACLTYSRAYIHHLIKTGEYFGANLVGIHNLTFYKNLMSTMRENIKKGTFLSFYNETRESLRAADSENPSAPTRKRKSGKIHTLGDYRIVTHEDGFHSIQHTVSNEIMHSVIDPIAEAETLYVGQSRMETEILRDTDEPFVVWDVGLGAATNAMATIFAYEKISANNEKVRPLHIISFENDLDSLRLTVKNPSLFPHIRHAAPGSILADHFWKSKDSKISWKLIHGEFLETLESAPPPGCIYYDLYSLNTNSNHWNVKAFSKIMEHCRSKFAVLLTYSVSTRVRAAMLASGFYVGKGAASGPKQDTTIAYTMIPDNSEQTDLLGAEWLARWERSSVGGSEKSTTENMAHKTADAVRNHPQFLSRS